MADIDDVLERLVTDPRFRAQLASDPAAALAGYALSPSDVELLAASLPEEAGDVPRGVEQRTSKSALLGLLASLAPTGSAGESIGIGRTAHQAAPGTSGPELDEVVLTPGTISSPEVGDELTASGADAAGGTSDGDLVLTMIDAHGAGHAPPVPRPQPWSVALGDVNADGADAELAAPADDDALPVPAVQKVRDLPDPERTGAEPPADLVAQEPPEASRVHPAEAFTVEEQVVVDSSYVAPPGPDVARREHLIPGGDDVLTVDDA